MLDYSSMELHKGLVFFINESDNRVEKIQVSLIID